ncbi:MAG: metalloregulator ArsR/SmtB family transcription factor [Patulibacter sp.]
MSTAVLTEPPAGDVFAALADPTRRSVLQRLADHGDGTATTLADGLPVSRVAVVKHLGVLDRAGLVAKQRQGREVRYRVQPQRLSDTARWMDELATAWDVRLAALKRLAEGAEAGEEGTTEGPEGAAARERESASIGIFDDLYGEGHLERLREDERF